MSLSIDIETLIYFLVGVLIVNLGTLAYNTLRTEFMAKCLHRLENDFDNYVFKPLRDKMNKDPK